MTTAQSRIILADDHPIILNGFCDLLKPKYDIVEMVENGNALVEAALRLKPDLIILDITMPQLNGIEAARIIRRYMPEVKLLFITMHTSPTYVKAAIEAGANGYILKSSGRSEILNAVENVLKGDQHIHLKNVAVIPLSPRERQILQLIAEGKSMKQIAYVLNISDRTAAFHKNNIKRKLGLQSVAELTRYTIAVGLI